MTEKLKQKKKNPKPQNPQDETVERLSVTPRRINGK